jgi:ABC-2 type transport system ATP-binding protein
VARASWTQAAAAYARPAAMSKPVSVSHTARSLSHARHAACPRDGCHAEEATRRTSRPDGGRATLAARGEAAVDAVVFENVVKRFGSLTVLDGMNLRLAAGETVALLGPNGAGKSTAVGLLLGLYRPDGGRVSVLGGPPAAAIAAGRVGAMLQSGALPPGVTVAEVVDCVRRLYRRPLPLATVLAEAGLTAIARRPVHRLSGGEAQRVRYALAIAGDPELVVLDEPTSAMDVPSRREFWQRMRALAAAGRTVLFATHHLEEADAVADRVIVLHRGRVVADGAPAAIKGAVATRTVRLLLPDADGALLRALPGVVACTIHGQDVRLQTHDADATVRALYAAGLDVRGLEVTGAGLEEAFLALTEAPGPDR